MFNAVMSDFLVVEPAMRFARLHSAAGGKVLSLYYYNYYYYYYSR